MVHMWLGNFFCINQGCCCFFFSPSISFPCAASSPKWPGISESIALGEGCDRTKKETKAAPSGRRGDLISNRLAGAGRT